MTIDPTAQRSFMTLLAVALVCAVLKWLPGDAKTIITLMKLGGLLGAGTLLGKAHLTKPGDIKPDPDAPANEVGPL
jgi:hypothetical protein